MRGLAVTLMNLAILEQRRDRPARADNVGMGSPHFADAHVELFPWYWPLNVEQSCGPANTHMPLGKQHAPARALAEAVMLSPGSGRDGPWIEAKVGRRSGDRYTA